MTVASTQANSASADATAAMDVDNQQLTIGVLALQGAFHEHLVAYKALGVNAVTVRTAKELANPNLAALVIPGMDLMGG